MSERDSRDERSTAFSWPNSPNTELTMEGSNVRLMGEELRSNLFHEDVGVMNGKCVALGYPAERKSKEEAREVSVLLHEQGNEYTICLEEAEPSAEYLLSRPSTADLIWDLYIPKPAAKIANAARSHDLRGADRQLHSCTTLINM